MTRRQPPARDGRRQHRLGAHGRLLAPQPQGGLDGETRGEERDESEGRSEVRVRQVPSSGAGQQFRKGLVLADEGVDGGADPAVGDADDQDAGAPSEKRSPLQPEGQTQRVPEARRCRGPAWPGRHEPCAEVAPDRQGAGRGDQEDRGRRQQQQGPPPLIGERPRLLGHSDRGEPGDGSVADVADGAQHECRPEHRPGGAIDDAGVLGDLRHEEGDAAEDEPDQDERHPEHDRPGRGQALGEQDGGCEHADGDVHGGDRERRGDGVGMDADRQGAHELEAAAPPLRPA